MAAAALIGAGVQILGGLIGMGSAKRKAREAAAKQRRLQAKLTSLENSRQEIKNPYESSEDLSSMMSNPYAQIGVATQAAEMQAEQADISLANTLDTIRSTGASAGGATALAQAALQSKKGVSANIEQQEARNEQLKAQGEQNLQQRQIAEKQRMQNVDAQGNIFEFNAREQREVAQMDRVAAQMDNASAQQAQAQADATGAFTGMVGALGGLATSQMNNDAALAQASITSGVTGNYSPPLVPSFPLESTTGSSETVYDFGDGNTFTNSIPVTTKF